MPTLAQELRSTLQQLDNAGAYDNFYREAFSTFAKTRLRPGETWRDRLVRWCESEERQEALDASANTRLTKWQTALNHWIAVGYSYETARALASVLHGVNADVRVSAKEIMCRDTNLRLTDMI